MSRRRQKFYNEQYTFGKDYLHKFLGMTTNQYTGLNVLEVGGGEFGLLKALHEFGAECTGIDISQSRVEYAEQVHKDSNITFYIGDICNFESISTKSKPFDLIVLRDVIEHIPDQNAALQVCVKLLKPGGLLYISFPPIYSPFGGHQQNFKYGKALPWIHILSNFLYTAILKLLGADEPLITALLQTKSTGITIRKISKIIRSLPVDYEFKKCYAIRPDFEIRFNLRQRACFPLNNIPGIRELFSTGCLFSLRKK